MRRFVLSASLSATLLAALAPAAAADETIRATFSNRFANPNVSIDQGEPLHFANGDASRHDVTATQNGADGRPHFSTPLLSQGQSAFVEGSQYLTTGSYPFICTVHPNMQGTVTVTSAGTPVPRPGTGGGTDATPPVLGVSVRASSRRGVRRAGAITVRVRSDEAGTATGRATARGRTIATGGRVTLEAGTASNMRLRLSRVGRRLLARRGALSVTVTVTARDAAGNRTVRRVRRTLR